MMVMFLNDIHTKTPYIRLKSSYLRSFLRPHSIPQSFLEYMETVETKWLKSILFVAKSARNAHKCLEKYSRASLGTRCRRFEPCHLDHQKSPKVELILYFRAFLRVVICRLKSFFINKIPHDHIQSHSHFCDVWKH